MSIIERGHDSWMQVFAYNAQGQSAVLAGIPGLCAAMGARILGVCDKHGQVLPRAYGLALLGEEGFFQGGDLGAAERLLSDAIPLFEAIGDAVAHNMFGLGILAAVEAVEGKLDAAERHAAEAAALGGPGWSATALVVLAAFVLIPTGDLDRAEDVLLTGLGRVHERSMLACARPALLMLGQVAAARGKWEQAGPGCSGAARPGIPAWALHSMFWGDEPHIRSALGDDRYESITTVAVAEDLDALVADLVTGQ